MAENKIPIGITVVATDHASKDIDHVNTSLKHVQSSFDKLKQKVKGSLPTLQNPIPEVTKLQEPMQTVYLPHEISKKRDEQEGKKPKTLIEDVNQGLSQLTSGLKNFLFVLAGSGGVTYLAKRFSSDLSQNLVDLSAASHYLNLPIEKIRQLSYVSKAAGISASGMNSALESLRKVQFDLKSFRMTDATQAMHALPKSHAIYGKDLIGSFRSTLDSLRKIHDSELKSRVTQRIFGTTEPLKLLEMSNPQIEKLFGQFKVDPIPKDSLQKARDYLAAMTDFGKQFEDLKYAIGPDILKPFTSWLEHMKTLVFENKDTITEFSNELSNRLPKAFDQLLMISKPVLLFLKALDDSIGLVNASLVALTAGIGFRMLGSPVGAVLGLSGFATVLGAGYALKLAEEEAKERKEKTASKQPSPPQMQPQEVQESIKNPKEYKDDKITQSQNLIVLRFENAPAPIQISKTQGGLVTRLEQGLILGGSS